MSQYSTDTDDYVSFLISRPGGQGCINFRIRAWVLKLGIASVSILAVVMILGAYFYTKAGSELANYRQLRDTAKSQENTLIQLNDQVDDLKNTVEDLIDKESEIRQILEEERRPKRRSRKRRRASRPASTSFSHSYAQLNSTADAPHISEKITFLESQLSQTDTKISSHYQSLQAMKSRFAYTPSIWPIPIPSIWPERGRIKSTFGNRIHPVTGRKRHHNGVDVPARFGTPIKATADGTIEFAGWSRGGFGYMVRINHGFGYRTVYAHASQVLVRKGQKVRKGQVIAQIGSTGLSTAPHLHYEVRRWNRPVHPRPYLESLNMFTAASRL